MKKILFSLVVLFISISLAQSLDSTLNGDKDLIIKTDPKRYVSQYNEYVRTQWNSKRDAEPIDKRYVNQYNEYVREQINSKRYVKQYNEYVREQVNSKRYVKQYNEYVRTQENSKRNGEIRSVIQTNNAIANKLNISASDMQAMKDKAKTEHTRDAAKAFFDEKIPLNMTDDKLEKSEHLKTVGLQKNTKRYVKQYNEYVRTQWNSKRDAEPIDKRYVNQYNEYVREQINSKRYVKQYNEYVRTQWNSKRDAEPIKQTDTQPIKNKRENCGEYIRFASAGSNADCYEYVRNRDRGKLKNYD